MLDLWINGVFHKDSNKYGGACVTTFGASLTAVSAAAWQFGNMRNGFEIRNKDEAALIAALLGLEHSSVRDISRLLFNSQYVGDILQAVKAGTLQKNAISTALLRRLQETLERQPQMGLQKVETGYGRMPATDEFAIAAAQHDKRQAASASKAYRITNYSLNTSDGRALEW